MLRPQNGVAAGAFALIGHPEFDCAPPQSLAQWLPGCGSVRPSANAYCPQAPVDR